MHILFLTLAYPLSGNNIYTDMVDELVAQGHFVTICVQDEARNSGSFNILFRRNICIITIPTGKITKTSLPQKGINTLLLESRFMRMFSQFQFKSVDILLYSTPPITFQKIIVRLKKQYNCVNYLLLKDIFPQNAVDLGIIKENSLLHKYLRRKEKKLYQYSDIIGCMSPANKKYLVENNYELKNKKINVTPNCVCPKNVESSLDKIRILKTYNIPIEAIHLIYGGNIGKPQGINFIIECLHIVKKYDNIFLTIVGDGTEFNRLRQSIDDSDLNIRLLDSLPSDAYRELLENMDIGLVFLDNRFTIPNFPSRILDYMNYSKPVIACTDIACDVKEEICDKGAGFWCRSDDAEKFKDILEKINNKESLINMGKISNNLLHEKYSVQTVVAKILQEVKDIKNGEFFN